MPNTEVQESATKAERAARRIEAARACEPSESPLERLARVWNGPDNSGTIRISGSGLSEYKPSRGVMGAIQRAVDKHRSEGLPRGEGLTKAERERAARSLREMAQRVEQGA